MIFHFSIYIFHFALKRSFLVFVVIINNMLLFIPLSMVKESKFVKSLMTRRLCRPFIPILKSLDRWQFTFIIAYDGLSYSYATDSVSSSLDIFSLRGPFCRRISYVAIHFYLYSIHPSYGWSLYPESNSR